LLLAFGWLCWWAVLAALLRFHRPAAIGVWNLMISWFTADLPLFHIVWEAGVAGVLVWLGALDHPAGIIGLAAVVSSWGGLLVVFYLQGRARPTSNEALERGLGADYLDVLPDERRASLRNRAPVGLVALPFHFPRRGLEIETGIAYGDHPTRNLLDVYRPTETDGPLPVLLQIHGGAWVLGNKWQQALPLMHHLARRGWVCVAINYRLGPKYKFPDQLIDVKKALAWVRENIAEYGGDPDLVVVTGGSAGGHLAALTALTPNRPEYQPGFEDVETGVTACMPFYGPTDFTDEGHIRVRIEDSYETLLRFTVMPGPQSVVPDLYAAMSPVHQVRPDAPPFFILQGAIDVLVWREENRYFSQRLAEVSDQPVVYWEVPYAKHMFDTLNSRRCCAVVDACERFVDWAVARARAAAGG